MDVIPLEDSQKICGQVEKNDCTVYKMKYGLIRIVGENILREITWNTYEYLKKLPSSFKGIVEIREIGLTIPMNQIARLEEKEAEISVAKNFTKLPTESLCLDENFQIINRPKEVVERENDRYYRATCHYEERNGIRHYYMDINQIKILMVMIRNPGYPHCVEKVLRYGIDIRDIHDAQESVRRSRRR
jgi:hypothetical protein